MRKRGASFRAAVLCLSACWVLSNGILPNASLNGGVCHFDAEVLHCTVLNLSTISLMFIHINQYVER